jgi:hypothetical protein
MSLKMLCVVHFSKKNHCEIDTINDACCAIFCDIRLAMVSKHLELALCHTPF